MFKRFDKSCKQKKKKKKKKWKRLKMKTNDLKSCSWIEGFKLKFATKP